MLTLLDGTIIVSFLMLSLGIGLYFTRRASKDTTAFFTGGRSIPWWLGGLSMVATTFAADTPLAVTELVRKDGIAGNWIWWSFLMGGMLTTFFFARYWRRAGVTTDLELISLRYSGRESHVLRGFKAFYFGLFLNAVIMGWVNIALMTLLRVFFDLNPQQALLWVAGAMILTTVYASLAGLLGVIYTDALQFVMAMLGCVILAVLVLQSDAVGGGQLLAERLIPNGLIHFFPDINAKTDATSASASYGLSLWQFVVFAGVQWWASWYPGAEPGGGGYIAQRILAAKNERHALASVLLFQLLHYAVRPWPWIIVGLATVVLYPHLSDEQYRTGYVWAMRDFLPSGLRGLMLVAFFSAYMSTISTHLNWGTSYLIQDLYKPYLQKRRSEKHYVLVARIATFLTLAVSLWMTTVIGRIEEAWNFILQFGAGTGLVLILRWYWWRVSAWSELIAMITPAVSYTAFWFINRSSETPFLPPPQTYLLIVAITTVVWVASAYIFPATDEKQLQTFYERVRPDGFWGKIKMKYENNEQALSVANAPMIVLLACWLLSVLMVYGLLFAIGYWLFADSVLGSLSAGISVLSGAALWLMGRKYDVFK